MSESKNLVRYQVSGMTCDHCQRAVSKFFKSFDPEAAVAVDLTSGSVEVHWTGAEIAREELRAGLLREDFILEPENLLEETRAKEPTQAQGAFGAIAVDESNSLDRSADSRVSAMSDGPRLGPDEADWLPVLLKVEGMSCASCVRSVEKALLASKDIKDAQVNLPLGTARITVKAEVLDSALEASLEAVAAAGYPARSLRSEDDIRSENGPSPWPSAFLSVALTAVILALEHLGDSHSRVQTFSTLALGWILLFSAGRRTVSVGLRSLFRGRPEMNSLVSVAMLASLGYSSGFIAWSTVNSGHPAHSMVHEAAMLLSFILIGRGLEHKAREAAFGAMRGMGSRETETFEVDRSALRMRCTPREMQVGDLVLVPRGARVPVDGWLRSGSGLFDESFLSGEPEARRRDKDALILAGSLALEGPISIEALRVGADSTLRQLVALALRAQTGKAPIQDFADRAAAWFVPAVLLIAGLTGLAWWLSGSGAQQSLDHLVAVLVMACPCALGLATPTAVAVATARAIKLGVLVKSAGALEALAGIHAVAFDKTGTLTEGRPRLVGFFGDGRWRKAGLALARESQHVLSKALAEQGAAIVGSEDSAAAEESASWCFEGVEERVGEGLTGVSGSLVWGLGGDRLLERLGVRPSDSLIEAGAQARARGANLVWLARGSDVLGFYELRDVLRREAAGVLEWLRSQRLEAHLITGDSRTTSEFVTADLALASRRCEARPDEKLERIDELRSEGPVAFVGDGINDAPALARAEVGLALAQGSELARQAGGLILTGGLSRLPTAISLSRATSRNIRQNLAWALIYNLLGLPLAAGAFSPWGLSLPARYAAIAMSLSSISVIANALRLRAVALVSLGEEEVS